MVKVTIYTMIIVLLSAIAVSATALSAAIPDGNETARQLDAAIRSTSHKYHLVTLPSTNKKRVDAMCIRFLSVIPKAMLIPKTEERTVYRLVAKTFDKIESAKKRKAELSQHRESPFLAVNENGYSVVVSSQLSETLALAEQKRLAGKNITTSILELRLPLKQFQMRSNESFAIRDAVSLAARLAKIGVITTLEPTAD